MQHKKYNVHYHFIDMVKGWKRHQLNEVTSIHLLFQPQGSKKYILSQFVFQENFAKFLS